MAWLVYHHFQTSTTPNLRDAGAASTKRHRRKQDHWAIVRFALRRKRRFALRNLNRLPVALERRLQAVSVDSLNSLQQKTRPLGLAFC